MKMKENLRLKGPLYTKSLQVYIRLIVIFTGSMVFCSVFLGWLFIPTKLLIFNMFKYRNNLFLNK